MIGLSEKDFPKGIPAETLLCPVQPNKIFKEEIVHNPEICSRCFKYRLHGGGEPPEGFPDFLTKQYYPALDEGAMKAYPPDKTDEMGQVLETSRPYTVCEEGHIDDGVDLRSKEELVEAGERVCDRLDEMGYEISRETFFSSLQEYKTSEEYVFRDFEVLRDAVADAVKVS